jgi:hypothetical protein
LLISIPLPNPPFFPSSLSYGRPNKLFGSLEDVFANPLLTGGKPPNIGVFDFSTSGPLLGLSSFSSTDGA